ncbi:hypothetical protein P7K49_016755 [Saguinus oedipus]|uniref:Uncharacterized protein n=1 Tax=Saguinus oedipus TaxID=9490 RepID=A0ABQ9VDI5_SAGOE|nr:hypothetical protein P7K49_016755 [Saguinus oedipus]
MQATGTVSELKEEKEGTWVHLGLNLDPYSPHPSFPRRLGGSPAGYHVLCPLQEEPKEFHSILLWLKHLSSRTLHRVGIGPFRWGDLLHGGQKEPYCLPPGRRFASFPPQGGCAGAMVRLQGESQRPVPESRVAAEKSSASAGNRY